MASIPFIGPAIRHRKPLTGARMIIVASAAAFAFFLIWASLAQLDEVTRGQGKVIPSSKLQVITAADAGHAPRNSSVACTSAGTSSFEIVEKPKLGK